MPFTVIQGTFHVVGVSPDGDSLRFRPSNPALLTGLPGAKVKISGGTSQLRLEGIDALETHYESWRQPPQWAGAARDSLLAFTGIGNVVWNATDTKVSAAADGTRGWILSRSIERNGRPVSFLFAGACPYKDGSAQTLTVPLLRKSYNHHALAGGLAYPTFYEGLFADLRAELAGVVRAARNGGLGLWPQDVTTKGFKVGGIADLTTKLVILPKLFRRLVKHVAAKGSAAGFKQVLEASREPVLDLTDANFTHFDTFIEARNGRLRLLRQPEDLVFDAMPKRPLTHFDKVLHQALATSPAEAAAAAADA